MAHVIRSTVVIMAYPKSHCPLPEDASRFNETYISNLRFARYVYNLNFP